MASNAPPVLFRILLGALMLLESWGAIATGWVHSAFVEPRLTFPIADFVWLRVLSGEWMYAYFGVMGLAAIGVTLGWRYRMSSVSLAVLWTGAYLAQTTHYNNHYYLAALIAWGMALVPAADRASLDVCAGRRPLRHDADPWIARAFRLQVLIVFSYAAVAKLYPGWLNGDYLRVNLGSKGGRWPLGSLVVQSWFQSFTIWAALIFDALVIPALWWRRTRVLGFLGLLGFNLFNSVVFRIGIFPYMVLALTVFFFSEARMERALVRLQGKSGIRDAPRSKFERAARRAPWVAPALAAFFFLQLALPLRHHFFRGDVAWTEEGHRMSWRMMLRTKSAQLALVVEDAASGAVRPVNQTEFLTARQQMLVASQPAMLFRFAQDLAAALREPGMQEPGVYARYSACSLNGSDPSPLYDPEVDLTRVRWNRFSRNEWVLDQGRSAH
ncbi:MAG: vitamin K-dependent gamma-carboxylase [Paracoccaceae bacterium]|jgi:vitamin K-dependent gamma-carboxylase